MNKSVSYPPNFRGLLWEPTYHDEVIMLFGILLPYFDESYAIYKCQRPFPDCFAFLSSKKSNKPVRIEFEVYSRDFCRGKGHDPKKCDVIVCWKDNWPECPKNIKVIQLYDIISRVKPKLILNPSSTPYKTRMKWNEKRFFDQAGKHPKGFIRKIYNFCRQQPEFDIRPGTGRKKATLLVYKIWPRNYGVVLWLWADGKIQPYFVNDNFAEPLQDEYRKRMQQISPQIKEHIEKNKKWPFIVIKNKREFNTLKKSLKWLARSR